MKTTNKPTDTYCKKWCFYPQKSLTHTRHMMLPGLSFDYSDVKSCISCDHVILSCVSGNNMMLSIMWLCDVVYQVTI